MAHCLSSSAMMHSMHCQRLPPRIHQSHLYVKMTMALPWVARYTFQSSTMGATIHSFLRILSGSKVHQAAWVMELLQHPTRSRGLFPPQPLFWTPLQDCLSARTQAATTSSRRTDGPDSHWLQQRFLETISQSPAQQLLPAAISL